MRKGNHDLLQWLNAGIDRVKADGTYEQLFQKWFGEGSHVRQAEIQKIRKGAFIALGVLVLIIGVGLLWVKMLRRAVAVKTFERQYLADEIR